MFKKTSFIFLLILVPVFVFSAGQSEKLVAANKAYSSGDFNKALSLYEEEEIDTPESPYIYFNKGLTYFRMEDYEKAKEAFLSAASKTKDLHLEAQAYYNLGNTAFFEAARHVESDLEKAIKLYQEAITNYQVALDRDETLTDPAHNIEVTRLIVKDLLDKLKKQQEQNAGEQKEIEEIVKKLAELIERENHTIEFTKTLKEEMDTKGVSASLKNNAGKIKKEQELIRKETRDVSGKLNDLITRGSQQGQQQQTGQLQTAKEHTDLSVNFQQLSENQLQTTSIPQALESEGKAQEELIKALQALTKPQDQQNQEQQDEKQDKEQEQKEQEMKEQAKDADDIIDEEQKEKRERQMQGQAGYQEVTRDW
ncbi:MAG: tetratricopeptide repeat protein [Spirochaetales bacterium]|nr:tetratricopeptide repeat protein [Spirochaetales bacterium]